jgi:1-acyl-sn-glycerol-3-phosphate acyltransferase
MNFLGLLAKVYFRKIEVIGNKEYASGLYLSNHRNGAIDGCILNYVLGKDTKFIVGTNLTKNKILCLVMGKQIDLHRHSNTINEINYNKQQLIKVAGMIDQGKRIVMFPEGTSHLNKGFLPIKKGAAFLISQSNQKMIVPVGLHYQKGWSFRSDVLVNIGEPMSVDGKNFTEKTAQIKEYLQSVYNDDYPFSIPKKNFLKFLCLTPFIIAFFISNLFALTIPYIFAKLLADDYNVITLWRIIFGVPIFLIQAIVYLFVLFFNPLISLFYILFTLLGLHVYAKWKHSIGII